jgi:hypothetical protein
MNKNDAVDTVVAIVIVLCFIAAIFAGVLAIDRYQCDLYATNMNINYRWFAIGGCMVQDRAGQYVPLDNWVDMQKIGQ